MLMTIRQNCAESVNDGTALEVLLVTSKNYEDTYTVVENLIDMHSFGTAIILFLDVNQSLILCAILYQGHATVKEVLTGFGIGVRLLTWLIESMWFKKKVIF
nr:unnamed protein product [Callosobruchus analis]